jgi:hypothetical protein
VIELISDGVPEEVAIDEASADPTLDPCAVVAPLLPYTVFAERQSKASGRARHQYEATR